jgi:photosystem II stability/assembly factor-like uncharacterized protein
MKNIFLFSAISLFVIVSFYTFNKVVLKKTRQQVTSFPYENLFYAKHEGHVVEDNLIYLEEAKKQSHLLKTRNRNLPWQQEGPFNVGGRINCIALKPNDVNTFFVGTADGGIFKTTNGGANYIPVFDNQSTLAISCIIYSPGNINVMYAGTGDQVMGGFSHMGSGVYKSIDGGTTWTNLGLNNKGCITKIIVDSTNPSIIYAGTTGVPFIQDNNRGMYKTTDGGATWLQILFLGNTGGMGDMVMHPTNSQIIYATGRNRLRSNISSQITGPATRIYKTSNGGATWDTLATGLPTNINNCRIGLAISNTDPSVLYALYVDSTLNFGGVYKTTNNGMSWALVSGSSTVNMGGFGWYFGKIIIDPMNNNNLYILAVDLYQSTNGAVSWNAITNFNSVHSDKHALVFRGNSNSYLLGTDGGMYQTANGASFSTLNNLPITQFYRCTYSPHDTTFYFGGAQDNGSNQGNSTNSSNWTSYYGGDGFKTVFHPSDPNIIYAEWQNGNIVASDDGGFNWNNITNDLTAVDAFWWDTPYFMSHANSDNIYCASYRVFKNTTGTFPSWDTISTDLTDGVNTGGFHYVTALNQNAFNAQKIYAGTNDGNLWKTDNDGANWINITANPLPDRYVTGITPSPNNTDVLFVSYSGYRLYDSVPYIFKSINNGTSFVNIAGNLPSFCINDIYVQTGHADSNIVIATDGGVYYTKNGGILWNRVGNNMPIIPVFDVDYNPFTKMLFAGTFARSMQSYPMDSLFVQSTSGLPTIVQDINNVNNIKIYPTNTHEFITIENDKVQKLVI